MSYLKPSITPRQNVKYDGLLAWTDERHKKKQTEMCILLDKETSYLAWEDNEKYM